MDIEFPQAIKYFLTAMALESKSLFNASVASQELPRFTKFLQEHRQSLKVR